LRIYKTLFIPTLLCGTESLTSLNKHKNRMQTSEMKYLRKVVGENQKRPCKGYKNKKSIKAGISRSIDGKANVKMVWTCSKVGVGNKTKISAGGKTRRRKRKRQTESRMGRICGSNGKKERKKATRSETTYPG
jgi:hypothetical protein